MCLCGKPSPGGTSKTAREKFPWGNQLGVSVRKTPPWGSKGIRAGKVSMGELAWCAHAESAPLGEQAKCTRVGRVPMGNYFIDASTISEIII